MEPESAVIVIGAGPLQVPLISAARQIQLRVIATDGNPEAPGLDLADEALVVSTYDAEATVQALHNSGLDACYRFQGVVTAGADVAPTVAAVAEAFGLPGIPTAIAERTHNKAHVRQILHTGLAQYQPKWHVCSVPTESLPLPVPDGFTHLGSVAATLGYPLVVKPCTERASRGITFVADLTGLDAAVVAACNYGRAFLLEERLVGSEHSVEAILVDGFPVWFNIVDRLFNYNSGIPIELGHVNPTMLDAPMQRQIQIMLLQCAQFLGVTWGPFKVDCIVTPDGPKVLEVTARLSGGWDCQRTSPLTGRYPMTQLLQLACGRTVYPQPSPKGYAACAAILPTPAMGTDLPTVLPWSALFVEWMLAPGAAIPALEHNAARLGFVFAKQMTWEAAWDSAATEARRLQALLETQEDHHTQEVHHGK